MNNNQKTWIKQSPNFMYQPIIKKLRRLENGADCVIVFVKLQALFAEFENSTINFNDYDESFASQLSDLIDEDIENIQSTLDLLIKQRIIISQNNNIFSWVDFQDSKIIKENSRTEYFREYKKRSRAKEKSTRCGQNVDKVWTRCGQNVDSPQYVHNMSTTHSQSEPSQPSDTRAKAKKETAQNEQVSTNTRTYIDINNNYNKDLSNKDLNIKLKDKQDINNKYLELENKDLNTKSLNNKNLNTKKLNNKNLKPKNINTRTRENNSQELVIKNNNCVKKSMNKDKELLAIAKNVITHFNLVTGSKYRIKSTSPAVQLIIARLKDGYEPQDFITVIDKKTMEWKNDQRMRRYLRPNTLFSNKHFEEYLNQPVCTPKSQDKAQLVYEQFDMLDEMFEGQPGLFDDILNEPKKDYFNRFDKEACA